MRDYNFQAGQSLIEIIFAIAIFTIGVITIGYLIIDARSSLHYATDLTQARLIAAEGIEAIASIKGGGFDLIPAGSYGLELSEGIWVLISTPDEQDKFTRSVLIEDVDVDNKTVTSFVTWNLLGGREKTISYATRFSNWQQKGGEAGDLDVETRSATVNATGTALTGIAFRNTSDNNLSITKVTVTWDAPVSLERLTIRGVEVFTASTSQPIASGEEIDLSNYLVNTYSGWHEIDEIFFDGDVSDTNFIIRFTMQDQSVRSVYVTP